MSFKKIFKKSWIFAVILIFETMNVPSISVKSSALELNANKPIVSNVSNDEQTVYSIQDLNSFLKFQLEQRSTSFAIRYKADTSNLKTLIQSGLDGILDNDDYLQSCIKAYEWSYVGYENDVTIKFDFSYHSTKVEEDYVNSEVTAILKDIIKVSMNDYQKEKAIHDYIVTHVAYDTTLKMYSAYDALKSGLTVCSGYAQLAYKMLNEAGIETKIVVGTGHGENHAWNLVKLDNVWYHLDCTWDDPVPDLKGRILYNYYNLNDKKMAEDHNWEKLDYPMASNVYKNKISIFDENEFEQWTMVGETTKVEPTKEWKINFSKEIDESSLKDSIFICKQGTNSNFPITLQLSEDKKSVKIAHNIPFEIGENYTIYINKDINNVEGDANLKNSIKMSFSILK